eukprot:c17685_g1_i2.p2 GENE.c17685_g1_i2~~c17685_g1_i2.p2  ORF type:complete len:147 (+),score=32.32 c17685_g1_i2:792-1232(+)
MLASLLLKFSDLTTHLFRASPVCLATPLPNVTHLFRFTASPDSSLAVSVISANARVVRRLKVNKCDEIELGSLVDNRDNSGIIAALSPSLASVSARADEIIEWAERQGLGIVAQHTDGKFRKKLFDSSSECSAQNFLAVCRLLGSE